jgi:hypothetical protein
MLRGRLDAWREIVERLVGREAQVVKGRGEGDGGVVLIRVAAPTCDQVPRVMVHPIDVPSVPWVVRAERLPIAVEHFVDER